MLWPLSLGYCGQLAPVDVISICGRGVPNGPFSASGADPRELTPPFGAEYRRINLVGNGGDARGRDHGHLELELYRIWILFRVVVSVRIRFGL